MSVETREPDFASLADARHVQLEFERAGGRDFAQTAAELEKFFGLTARTSAPLAMISRNIDLLWHKFLEFTEHYREYCDKRFGRFIDHRPRTAATPVPDVAVRNFYAEYQRAYGRVGDFWERDAPMELVAYGRGSTDRLAGARWSGWPGRQDSGSA
jgi:hypothetical protein